MWAELRRIAQDLFALAFRLSFTVNGPESPRHSCGGIGIKLRAQPEAANRRWEVLGRFLRELSVHPFILKQII